MLWQVEELASNKLKLKLFNSGSSFYRDAIVTVTVSPCFLQSWFEGLFCSSDMLGSQLVEKEPILIHLLLPFRVQVLPALYILNTSKRSVLLKVRAPKQKEEA